MPFCSESTYCSNYLICQDEMLRHLERIHQFPGCLYLPMIHPAFWEGVAELLGQGALQPQGRVRNFHVAKRSLTMALWKGSEEACDSES